MRNAIFLSGLFLVLSSGVVFGASDDEEYVTLMSSLQHGDKCSWKSEQKRQEFAKLLIGDNSDILGKIEILRKWKEEVLQSKEQFCSAVQLFVCDKETERCVCGDPGKQGSTKLTDFPNLYSTEIVDGKTTCRWAEGTSCVSEDYLKTNKLLANYVDSKCAKSTQCTAVSDGSRCTFFSVLSYRLKNRKDTTQQFTEDIANKKVCTCQYSYDVIDDTGDNSADSSPLDRFTLSRSKRDAEGIENDLTMALGGAMLQDF